MDFDSAAFKTDLQRAVEDGDAIESLNVHETMYFIHERITGDVPEGHPSDHERLPQKKHLRAWALAIEAADVSDELQEAAGDGSDE